MRLRNTEDLRDVYTLIKIVERGPKGPCTDSWLAETKRKVREYTHRTTDRRVWDADMDGCTELITIPAEIKTADEAEEWFDRTERIEHTPGMYDCTGRPFTAWHHIGILGGRLVCWHRINADV